MVRVAGTKGDCEAGPSRCHLLGLVPNFEILSWRSAFGSSESSFHRRCRALRFFAVHATVQHRLFYSFRRVAQPLGTRITWTATATDSNAGPLTFQYSVAYGGGAFSMLRDYYPGALSAGTSTGPAFVWQQISEGTYHVKVIAKDFQSGETATATAVFTLQPLSTGGAFVVTPTANPLVALGSAPPCPVGSFVRPLFRSQADS